MSTTYKPTPVPGSFTSEQRIWLAREFAAIKAAMEGEKPSERFQTLYAQPEKYADGDVVKADGTTWNPGAGAGVYVYRSGAWHLLG